MTDRQAWSRAVSCTVLCLFTGLCLYAQQTGTRSRSGMPQDWSVRQIVFSREALMAQPELLAMEPRIEQQVLQRWGGAEGKEFQGVEADTGGPANTHHRDWNVALGTGRLAPFMFPAKYSFDPGAPPSCSNDYVAYGLNVTGSTGGQANLVGFNNLYSGTGGLCGAAPTVMFAYNITTVSNGKVLTSPVLSVDGTKIAFVESSPTGSIFHVLTWKAGQGTISGAATPNMTSLTFTTANSTRSSPWVDYNTDTAYMGADDGKVYKIKGVFKSNPTLAGAPWPITLSANLRVTAPVLDFRLGKLMVGSQNGTLYSINTTTGAVTSIVVGRSGATNPGILAPPIVDVTNGTTFVVSSNDGASAVFVEVDTSKLTQLAKARIGLGSKSGSAVNLQQPAFDNNYFNNPSTGFVRLCGTGASDITPWQYAFGFTGKTMNTTPAFSKQLVNSTSARCTGWTEFFNPNIGGGTDFFFFGLTADCTGGGTSGCVVERVTDASVVTFNLPGGPSGIVTDNYSTAGQASSIYLTDQKTPNAAYKLTQNGLQ